MELSNDATKLERSGSEACDGDRLLLGLRTTSTHTHTHTHTSGALSKGRTTTTAAMADSVFVPIPERPHGGGEFSFRKI